MNGKVKVDVFGLSTNPLTGKNSLMLRKYFSLVNYFESSDIANKVDLHFIDTSEPAMANYPAVRMALHAGRPMPIVTINGTIRYSGDIPYESIYQDAKRIISS